METVLLENQLVWPMRHTLAANLWGGIQHLPSTCYPLDIDGRLVHDPAFCNSEISQPDKTKHLSGRFIFGGTLFDHFGHQMADHALTAIGAAMLAERYLDARILFCPMPQGDLLIDKKALLSKTSLGLINYLGISDDRLVFINTPTLIEQCLVPHLRSSDGQSLRLAKDTRKYLTTRTQNLPPLPTNKQATKLYVSRRNFNHEYAGKIAGEAIIADLFAANGYTVLDPEDMFFKSQLRHYGEADEIVFAEGSAFHALEALERISARIHVILRRPSFEKRLASYFSQKLGISVTFHKAILPGPLIVGLQGTDKVFNKSLSFLNHDSFRLYGEKELGLNLWESFEEDMRTAEIADLRRYLRYETLPDHFKPVSKIDRRHYLETLQAARPDLPLSEFL